MAHDVRARLTPRELRRFALTLGTAFAALGALLLWRGRPAIASGLFAVAGLLVLGGLVAPGRLGPIQRVWMAFALAISKVTTPIILGVLYFLVVTPTGLVRRVLGGNPVRRPAAESTYWVPRQRRRSDLSRQF